MPELTQFKDSYPIIRDVPISTGAEGNQKIAEVFGNVSKNLQAEAVSLKKEQKDAMILHDSNRLIEISNKAKEDMRLNPNQADLISKKAKEAGETILNTANPGYKEKLRSVYDSHLGSVGVEAAGITYKQNLLQTKKAFYNEQPEAINDLHHTYNDKQFLEKALNLHKNYENALAANIITPREYNRLTQILNGAQKRHEALLRIYSKGDADAATYSHATNYQATNNHSGDGARPSEEDHNEISGHYNQEDTYARALSDVQKGNFPDPETFSNLTDAQAKAVEWQHDGAIGAKALWDVHKSHDYILHDVADLEAKANAGTLSDQERGALAYHKYKLKQLDNGDGQEVSVNTNAGSRSFQQYQDDKAAIEATHYTAPTAEEAEAKKAQALHENDIDYMYRQRADDDASGRPLNQRGYISADKMIPIRASFAAGGDPMTAINTIYTLPKDMQYWPTVGLKDPVQKAALWSVALRRNSMPGDKPADIFSVRLVKAAQARTKEQIEYENKVLSREKGETTPDSKIRTVIESDLSSQLNYMNTIPEGDKNTSAEWRNGTIQLGVQYVKDRMIETGDYAGDNASKFVKEYTDGQARNYKIFSGMNYAFNLNEINLPKGDLDALAAYEIINFQEHSQKYAGHTLAEMAQDLAHPNVVNTRDGSVAIVSPDGTILHSERITPSLINLAVHRRAERQLDAQRQSKQSAPLSETMYLNAEKEGIMEVPAQ